MGFIERDLGIPAFSKAVISLWFRVTQEAIDAAVAQYQSITVTSGSLEDGNLPGIIPLVTFGVSSAITGAVPDTTSRCFIGISCGHRRGVDIADELPIPAPRLVAYLQYDSGDINYPGDIHASEFFQIGWNGVLFCDAIGADGNADGGSINVTPDAWHHGLVSFDMSAGCETQIIDADRPVSFNSGCQFWWAFDDVNYNGDYLWPSNPNGQLGYSGPLNDIYSAGCLAVGSDDLTPGVTRSFAAGNLPSEDGAFGIPAASVDLSRNQDTIMTELQVFTDVSIDTGVEANRRAFVTEDGHPAAPSNAATLLGKDPEIYFRTHSDWINGINSGTAGDFIPTGTVLPFTPGP